MTSVLVNTQSTEVVSVEKPSTSVISTQDTNTITITNPTSIVVEKISSQVVLSGMIGPAGLSAISEDSMQYSKRIDFVSDSELYRGEALAGTPETSSLWRIRKIVIGSDGDVTETWAEGSADFTKAWTNRAALTYI